MARERHITSRRPVTKLTVYGDPSTVLLSEQRDRGQAQSGTEILPYSPCSGLPISYEGLVPSALMPSHRAETLLKYGYISHQILVPPINPQ